MHSKGRRTVSFKGNHLVIAPMVVQAFPEVCGEYFYGCNVHHIIPIEEGGDDSVTNLQILTQQQHIQIHQEQYKKVKGYYLGDVIGTFNSMAEAQKETGCGITFISSCCRGKKPKASRWYDYDWKYAA
jgi:hypothetical protein